jgi:CheY-like chemotaxis protein
MAKVLLVEDDNNLREIYEARLQAEGYEIAAAQDGEQALVVAKQFKPDLVISDVMMPKISGFEMLDILRNTDGLEHTRVIMLTALGQAEDKTRADKLGADRYLVKSQVTLEDIVKSAHEILDGDNASAAAATGLPVQDNAPAPASVPLQDATVVAAPGDEPAASVPVVDAPASVTPAPPVEPVSIPVTVQPEPVALAEPVAATPPAPDTTVEAPPAPAPASAESATPAVVPGTEPAPELAPEPSAVPAPQPASVPVSEPVAVDTPVAVPVPEAAPAPVAVPDPAPASALTPEVAPTESPQPSQAPETAPTPEAVDPTEAPKVIDESTFSGSANTGAGTTASEQQVINKQIEEFINQTDSQTTAEPLHAPGAVFAPGSATPAPDVTAPVTPEEITNEDADNQLLADAANTFADKSEANNTAAATPPPAAAPTSPAPRESLKSQVDATDDGVTIAHKKVIQPPEASTQPDLTELLAREEAKESGLPPAPVAASTNAYEDVPPPPSSAQPEPATPDAPTTPPADQKKPTDFDPNSIAL